MIIQVKDHYIQSTEIACVSLGKTEQNTWLVVVTLKCGKDAVIHCDDEDEAREGHSRLAQKWIDGIG